MTPQEFSAKWADNELKESAASKEHFLDVCALVGSPTPRDADKQGDWFAFEKGVAKGSLAGVSSKNGRKKQGFADVFLRGSFAWGYKGPHKDLDGADDGTSVALLRTAFSEPYSLVPGKSREAITREVAERFGVLAKGLRERGEEPHAAASFLMRLVFCAHTALDRAVFAAYGWAENPEELPDEEILKRLLALNLERAAKGEAP